MAALFLCAVGCRRKAALAGQSDAGTVEDAQARLVDEDSATEELVDELMAADEPADEEMEKAAKGGELSRRESDAEKDEEENR